MTSSSPFPRRDHVKAIQIRGGSIPRSFGIQSPTISHCYVATFLQSYRLQIYKSICLTIPRRRLQNLSHSTDKGNWYNVAHHTHSGQHQPLYANELQRVRSRRGKLVTTSKPSIIQRHSDLIHRYDLIPAIQYYRKVNASYRNPFFPGIRKVSSKGRASVPLVKLTTVGGSHVKIR